MYRGTKRRRAIEKGIITPRKVAGKTLLLAIILTTVSFCSLFLGTAAINITHVLGSLMPSTGFPPLSPAEEAILFSLRLPRIVFAGIVGAGLATAGAVFQALLRNPLADPYVLGLSGGAAVGAIIGIILGAGAFTFGVPLLAFVGAVLTLAMLFGISSRGSLLESNTLILSGVIVNAFFSAAIMFLISLSGLSELRNVLFWLMGDLSLAGKSDIAISGLFLLVGFLFIYREARSLNLIVMGEQTALFLGVDVEKTKLRLLIFASLITAAAVSISGIIGFVGLMVPHLIRMILGSDHRLTLPSAALFGASFLIVADTVARTAAAPLELPVGAVTAICGAPYFVYLLRKKEI
ncbi:MAG: iron ABC transporter permease [Smithellaceae bacterium]|nr:iron ABC transporter permease [Smithellaceae bacterium]